MTLEYAISPEPTDAEAAAIASAIAAYLDSTEAENATTEDRSSRSENRWGTVARIAPDTMDNAHRWRPPTNSWKAAGRYANR